MENRLVDIYEWERLDHEQSIKKKIGEGVFLAWGIDYEQLDMSCGVYSVALIEMSDGFVETVPACLIRFQAKKEDKPVSWDYFGKLKDEK